MSYAALPVATPSHLGPDAPVLDRVADTALAYGVDIGIALITASIILCLLRIIKGPNLVDRGVASDTVAVQVAALVLLLTIRVDTIVTFDAVLIVSILGFVATLAFAQFIGRRRSVAE